MLIYSFFRTNKQSIEIDFLFVLKIIKLIVIEELVTCGGLVLSEAMFNFWVGKSFGNDDNILRNIAKVWSAT